MRKIGRVEGQDPEVGDEVEDGSDCNDLRADTHSRAHARTHTHTRARAHTHTNTHTPARTRARAHTHTHTQAAIAHISFN